MMAGAIESTTSFTTTASIKPKNNGTQGTAVNCLTSVDYSDGTHAYYTYKEDKSPEHHDPALPLSYEGVPRPQDM